jgi:hypothetical protein
MACIPYYEQKYKSGRLVLVKKVLITDKKDNVIYDGEFKPYDKKLIELMKKYFHATDYEWEKFKERHGIIE